MSLAQGNNTPTRSRIEPGSPGPEADAITTRPVRSPYEKTCFMYMKKQIKTNTRYSFMKTVQLISTFVFPTYIVQYLYSLNPKFQASRNLLWLYSSVCVTWSKSPKKSLLMMRLKLYGCTLIVTVIPSSMTSVPTRTHPHDDCCVLSA